MSYSYSQTEDYYYQKPFTSQPLETMGCGARVAVARVLASHRAAKAAQVLISQAVADSPWHPGSPALRARNTQRFAPGAIDK